MQLCLHCAGLVQVCEVWPWQTAWLSRVCCGSVYLSLPFYKELVRRAMSMVHLGLHSAGGLWISHFCALLLPIVAIIWVVDDSVMGFHVRVLVDAQPLLTVRIKRLCSSHCLL